MKNGLGKGIKTIFINGYAIQYFATLLKNTKIIIYVPIHENRYISMCEYTLDYVADDYSVESSASEKIKEIESL